MPPLSQNFSLLRSLVDDVVIEIGILRIAGASHICSTIIWNLDFTFFWGSFRVDAADVDEDDASIPLVCIG